MNKNKIRLWVGLNVPDKLKSLIFLFINILKSNKNFFTYHTRPALACNLSINALELRKQSNQKLGIVIQGPLKTEKNFTYETIKLYKKNFPNSFIVVSTWENEDEVTIEKIRDLGVEVLKNKKPENIGHANSNFQITSTRNGILFLEGKVEYILKTRTDQRINGTNVFHFLTSLLNKYPINDEVQKERIIGININTSRYKMYSISDMFQFGHIDDMKKIWCIDLKGQKLIPKNYYLGKTLREVSEITTAESFLIKNYLSKLGVENRNTLEAYYKILADRFIIIDKEMIDLYWFKYLNMEYFFSYNYLKDRSRDKIGFKEWIILENRFKEIVYTDAEKVLNQIM